MPWGISFTKWVTLDAYAKLWCEILKQRGILGKYIEMPLKIHIFNFLFTPAIL